MPLKNEEIAIFGVVQKNSLVVAEKKRRKEKYRAKQRSS